MSYDLSLPDVPGAPLYARAMEAIRNQINERRLSEGALLPSEHDLAAGLGVSRVTLRRAVHELVLEGLLIRKQGLGTFVARERVVHSLKDLQSTRDLALVESVSYLGNVIKYEVGPAAPDELERLKLPQHASVVRFARFDSVSGQPFGLAEISVPEEIGRDFTEKALATQSTYSLFRDVVGIEPARAIQKLRSEPATSDVAQALGIQPGEPTLCLDRITFSADDTPIEWGQIHYRHDVVEFEVVLGQTGPSSTESRAISPSLRNHALNPTRKESRKLK